MTHDLAPADWARWHNHYDIPGSPLANRLAGVRDQLRRALTDMGEDDVLRLVSVCAGEGRDLLPVLAESRGGPRVSALLLELDPTLADRAHATAAALGLSDVEVRAADAGLADTYLGLPPVNLMMVCGVFGHTSLEDAHRIIDTLPALLSPGGVVIWTRSRGRSGHDHSLDIRASILARGFAELSFASTADHFFRVGMNQLTTRPEHSSPPLPGTRIFTFV